MLETRRETRNKDEKKLGRSSMKTIALYIDDGASFETLLRELSREMDHSRARAVPVMAEDLLTPDALNGIDTLVMSGGADLPFCAKLDGAGNHAIKDFVEAGGTYLGICAGGYYGCRTVAFHEGRPDEVSGPRELAFVDARAVGSLTEIGPAYDLTIASASAASLDWPGIGMLKGYYHGGPRFDLAPTAEADIFATYSDVGGAPAGVGCAVGEGKTVLIGVHLEMTGEALALKLMHLTDGHAYRPLVTLIKDSEAGRRAAFRDLLARADIPVKEQPA